MDFGIIEKLTKCIVRPPRSTYNALELGPTFIELRNRSYQRDDFTVINNRGLELKCSFIRDQFAPTARETILFLHANSSCRLVMYSDNKYSKNYIEVFLPSYDLLAFDFAGCGMSEGQYVTLGYNQREDVYSVISRVRERYGVRDVILWGRSMGASTAILYAAKYGGIKAMICDNSFSDLEVLINQLSDEYIPFLPSFLVNTFVNSIQEHIEENVWKKEMTDFNIKKLKPKAVISRIKCPIFFIGSLQDTFVNVQHTKLLYEKAKSFKKLQLVKGNHNDLRTKALKESILSFLQGLNTNTVRERISIFKQNKGSALKKNLSDEQEQKIINTPYCIFPTHFISDREVDSSSKDKSFQQNEVPEDILKEVLMENYQQQIKRLQKNKSKSPLRQSTPRKRRIFDGYEDFHKRASEK